MNLKKIWKGIKIIFYAIITYRSLSRSRLFNPEYYREKYPDLSEFDDSKLLFHYLLLGYRERRQPSPLLNPEYYYRQIKFLDHQRIEPIHHYMKQGWRDGVNPNPLFDTTFCVSNNPEIQKSKLNPVDYYVKNMDSLKNSTLPCFDPDFYLTKYPEVRESCVDPLSHYLWLGCNERKVPIQDASLYLMFASFEDRQLKFADQENDVLQRFIELSSFGSAKKLTDNPVFDPSFFWRFINDIESHNETLFQRFNEYINNLSNRPCPWFDPKYYSKTYLEYETGIHPLEHYLKKGIYDGYYPSQKEVNLKKKPLISIIVPVYNVDPSYLNTCIRSVLFQSYPHWELCLADDCSTKDHVKEILNYWQEKDKRIKVVFLEKNQGISGATNAGVNLATGEYYGFLDNDDELKADCLYEVVNAINETGAEILYSDEDLTTADGERVHTFYKPDYNEELLLCHNYITHFVVTLNKHFHKVGGFDSDKDGAQDLDLLLKLSEQVDKIHHIPKSLYNWRGSETSTSINHDQKGYAGEAGKRAVEDALKRRQVDGEVLDAEWAYYFYADRKIIGSPTLSIVFDLRTCSPDKYENIFSTFVNHINNHVTELFILLGSESTQKLQIPEDIPVGKLNTIVDNQTSSSVLYNKIVTECSGEHIVFVDGHATPGNSNWINKLLSYSLVEDVGCVRGWIFQSDENNYSVGRTPDLSNDNAEYYGEFLSMCSTHMNGLQWAQDIFVTGLDICMLKTKIISEFGGFSEKYANPLFMGLDLSLRIHQAQYRNIHAPLCRFFPLDTTSTETVGGEKFQTDSRIFKDSWQEELRRENPFYNTGILEFIEEDSDRYREWLSSSS